MIIIEIKQLFQDTLKLIQNKTRLIRLTETTLRFFLTRLKVTDTTPPDSVKISSDSLVTF